MERLKQIAEWLGDAWCRFAHDTYKHTRPVRGTYQCLTCHRRWELPW